MENQPAIGRQWFRLASQARMELPSPAPAPAPAPAQQPVTAGPPPRRGPPIRQASIALARSALALEAPEPAQTQPTQPPPPSPRVETPPPPVVAAPPPPPPTAAPPRVPSPSPSPTMAPPKAPTPPPAIAQPTTITLPRTITPQTAVTLPRTITPPSQPAPPKTQTSPPTAEPPERKFNRELTPATATEPPKPATPPPPTVATQPSLARPPSGRNSNGDALAGEKPSVAATPTVAVFPRPAPATRALTPPDSPKIIKTSPTPPQSPRIKLQQSAANMMPRSEPEPRSLLAPQPKSNGLQDNSDRNNGSKTNAGGQGELQKFVIRNVPPRSPNKEEKHAAMANGKSFATRKDEKEMRIITIAGENHGAIMDLGSGHQLQGRNHLLHHAKSPEGQSGSSDDGKASKMSNAMSKTKPMISLTNSNVQCVNNSILFNASSVNRNPGVHINFIRRHQPKNTTSSTPQGGHPTLH